MTRSLASCLVAAVALLLITACGDDSGSDIDASITLIDASEDDATPPIDSPPPIDAQLFDLGPALGIDELSLAGTNPTFQALGLVLNDMIQGQIDSGTLLLALELRGLDDPAGQDDAELTVGFYSCNDWDENPANNFDAENPDRWVAASESVDGSGNPVVEFPTASTSAGVFHAEFEGELMVPGLPIPFPILDPTIDGLLVAAPDDQSVHFLDDDDTGKALVPANLDGTVEASFLATVQNLASQAGCAGDNLLDVLALGCPDGIFPFAGAQPDRDLDADGLEVFCDSCDDAACGGDGGGPDAAMPDNVISCCVDGDGTVVEGNDCTTDARFADGYQVRLLMHGTRIYLASTVQPQ